MTVSSMLLVALGGALGSVARALAGYVIPNGRLPWATIVVNIAGSLLIGVLMGRLMNSESESAVRSHSFWVIGVCGGFTTFSTFSWQTIALLQKGNAAAAAANVLVSVFVCLAATWVGVRLGR
jgi:fluoride exporter